MITTLGKSAARAAIPNPSTSTAKNTRFIVQFQKGMARFRAPSLFTSHQRLTTFFLFLRQLLHLHILYPHLAAEVVLLEREVAFHVGVLRIHVIARDFVVDLDDDVVAVGDHFMIEPRGGRTRLSP